MLLVVLMLAVPGTPCWQPAPSWADRVRRCGDAYGLSELVDDSRQINRLEESIKSRTRCLQLHISTPNTNAIREHLRIAGFVPRAPRDASKETLHRETVSATIDPGPSQTIIGLCATNETPGLLKTYRPMLRPVIRQRLPKLFRTARFSQVLTTATPELPKPQITLHFKCTKYSKASGTLRCDEVEKSFGEASVGFLATKGGDPIVWYRDREIMVSQTGKETVVTFEP